MLTRESLRNPAWRTDALFSELDGSVVSSPHDDEPFLVVRSPRNLGYWWGNCLIHAGPPAGGEQLARRIRAFRTAFGAEQGVDHVALGWDGLEESWGAASSLLGRDGWVKEHGHVLGLRAGAALADAPCAHELRPLRTGADWAASDALNRRVGGTMGSGPAHAIFLRRLRQRYRALVEEGHGEWIGAFDGERLVAHLGIFHDGPFARFQSVETAPEARGRGAASALVRCAALRALERWGVTMVVIVATPGTTAERIYERLGFERLGHQCGIARPPDASPPGASAG